MQNTKRKYLHRLLWRSEHNRVEKFAEAINRREEEIRKEYSEDLSKFKSKEFVEMLVLDGCFVVEFLLEHAETSAGRQQWKDIIGNQPRLRCDMLLLENQIPFFVLDTIFQQVTVQESFPARPGVTLLDLAAFYLSEGTIGRDMLGKHENTIFHLLHLEYLCGLEGLQQMSHIEDPPPAQSFSARLRNRLMVLISRIAYCWISLLNQIMRFFRLLLFGILFFSITSIETLILGKRLFRSTSGRLPTWTPPGDNPLARVSPGLSKRHPTAVQLDNAGMLLRKKEDATTFLDVSFNDGILEIPVLLIDPFRKAYFKNLLAFEQSIQGPCDSYHYSSYVVLMTNLIKTTSDVALLRDRGIIQSRRRDQDLLQLFNRCGSDIVLSNEKNSLGGLFKKVDEYYNQDYHRWRAMIMTYYLDHPRVVFALTSALIIIGLTAVQTFK